MCIVTNFFLLLLDRSADARRFCAPSSSALLPVSPEPLSVCCVICRLFHEIYPIHANTPYFMYNINTSYDSSTASPPFHSKLMHRNPDGLAGVARTTHSPHLLEDTQPLISYLT